MNVLIKAAMMLAAGAAGWALAKRCKKAESDDANPQVLYLSDDDAVIDAEPAAVAATAIGGTSFAFPVAWLGSTITGRWLRSWRTETADKSSVLRV